MGGGSKKQTVGYRYHLGMHMVLCAAPVDKITRISVDKKIAWNGDFDATVADDSIVVSNARSLFGGDDREGGVGGVVDVLTGLQDSSANGYLQTKLGTLLPKFLGVLSLVFRGSTWPGKKAFYFGNNPYLKNWSFRVQRIHVSSSSSFADTQWYDEKAEVLDEDDNPSGDMNPAHIIRECLVNVDWGMGYTEGDIDYDSFELAADTLYNEKMGISLLWDRQITIDEFIGTILRHIDAVLFIDRATGNFVLKLIRDDYNIDDLISLEENDIDKVEDFRRAQFGELTTSINVAYWDKLTNTKATTVIQDIALEQMQNNSINTTIQYPGFTNKSLAARAAARDLKALSSQLASCTVYADRTAKPLQAGSVFLLTWPDFDLDHVPMRVTGVGYGDGRSNRIRLTCTEDVFSLDDSPIIPVTPPVWEDPQEAPIAVVNRLPVEMPYLEFVQQQGITVANNWIEDNPDVSFAGIAATRPNDSAINAELWTDAGSGFDQAGILDFCPTAVLSENIDRIQTTFRVSGIESLDSVTIGSWIQFGTELMSIEGVGADYIIVKRGVLDTVPVEHTVGEVLYCWDAFFGLDQTEYVQGETIDIKLLTRNGGETLDIGSAPADSLLLVGRVSKPYPPGNLKVNDEYFPAYVDDEPVLTWVHRDRLQQTGGVLIGFTEAGIGPEAGTTYTVRVYGPDDTLLRTASAISGTSYTYSTANESSDGGPFSSLRFEVESVRDSKSSFQFHNVTVLRGGGEVITEDRENFGDEENNIITLE